MILSVVCASMRLPVIGKLLGGTQVQAAQRYDRPLDDLPRAVLEEVAEVLKPKQRIVASKPL